MPDADRKRARDEAGSAEAGAGLPIDTQAGFTMLRMMLPALRPQQKNSRCAEDTLALIIEQWVIDAKAALRESGGGEAFASYTPTLRKALNPKQRQKARENMRADAVLSQAMSAVSAAKPEEKPLVIEFVRELATPEGRARLISSYGGQHEDHGDDADDGGADDEAGGQPACAACTMTGFEREVRARVCARGSGRRIVRAPPDATHHTDTSASHVAPFPPYRTAMTHARTAMLAVAAAAADGRPRRASPTSWRPSRPRASSSLRAV